jgi:membrane-associated protein
MHSPLLQFLIVYKYTLLIPIAFVEGHAISLVVGFAARLGYLNPFFGGALVAIGNLLGDTALYWLGFYKGKKFARSWGVYIGITDTSLEKAEKIFHTHKRNILLASKMTNGLGLAMAVLFTAGMTRIPFRIYMFWNTLGELFWTGMLVAIGYFFGELYTTIENVTWRIGLIVISILAVFLFFQIGKYIKNKANS